MVSQESVIQFYKEYYSFNYKLIGAQSVQCVCIGERVGVGKQQQLPVPDFFFLGSKGRTRVLLNYLNKWKKYGLGLTLRLVGIYLFKILTT